MIAIVALNALIIVLVVSIHYEALRYISELLPRLTFRKRIRVVIGLFGVILAHIVEVLLFGCAYYILIHQTGLGDLGNIVAVDTPFDDSLVDCIYFSFTVYTSLGFGDIAPVGPLRFLAGVETLVGLVMIGWTASFLYVEMTRFWEKD